jgi:hypothetical protein
MAELVQVKAEIPRDLKRRTFAELALREVRFNHWLQTQMVQWLNTIEGRYERVVVTPDGDHRVRRPE